MVIGAKVSSIWLIRKEKPSSRAKIINLRIVLRWAIVIKADESVNTKILESKTSKLPIGVKKYSNVDWKLQLKTPDLGERKTGHKSLKIR